jgi:hypothetical protein
MHFLNGILTRLYKRTPRAVQKDLFATSKDPLADWLVMERLETNPDEPNNYSLLAQTWRLLAEQNQFDVRDDFFAELGVLFEPQTSKKFENSLNARRLESLRERFSQQLLTAILEGEFEYGYESEADRIVAEALDENVLATKSWLGELFREQYGDVAVLTGLLRVFSRLEHKVIQPEGEIFATAAIAHQDPLVKECAIRCFESWSQPSSLPILENVELHEPWLQSYRDRVMDDIRHELCVSS